MSDTITRIKTCISQVVPGTAKTCWWIVKLTVGVSAAMLLLKYFGILPIIAKAVNPIFSLFGLPGDTALAFVSGYFVNVYSALAVIGTLDLTTREITILGTMVLCAHSMILETAVLKKTGVSAARMVIIRTLGAILIGIALNWLLPADKSSLAAMAESFTEKDFIQLFLEWLKSTAKLVVMMTVIIFSLNILQKLLQEFGIMAYVSKFLRPVMHFFGLPEKCAFLWIVANIVGLGYGAAAMLDEISRGTISKKDIYLIDTHISVSHSNLEDLLLISAAGAIFWVALLIRWALSLLLVWEFKLENMLLKR
ncbi:MAG: nucleoside recognition protein [Bacteroidales bacterium]|nr:nucleoside recognition protein [Bacteroidales bacterium]